MPSHWIVKRLGRKSTESDIAPQRDDRTDDRMTTERELTLVWHDAETGARSARLAAVDVSAGGFGILTPNRLEPGELVLVGFEEGPLDTAVVRHCSQIDEETCRIGVKVIDSDRRRIARASVEIYGRIYWLSESNESKSAAVKIVNISEFGCQIELHEHLPVAAAVRIEADRMNCIGHVRYCVERRTNHLAGLVFCRSSDEQNRNQPGTAATYE